MSRFVNTENGVTISVDDSKDERFTASGLWESADEQAEQKSAPKRRTTKSDEK